MSNSRKKILWADDEIEFLRAHILFLESRGYNVTSVYSGDDALKLLFSEPLDYDIVLLDEQMPGKDGLTTLEEIKARYPDLPVVMVTKNEEERIMDDAIGLKIDAYLTKPVNPSQILSICKRLLDSSQIITTQTAQQFMRDVAQLRILRQHAKNATDWMQIYDMLVKWDMVIDEIGGEELRQVQAGQKADTNQAFCHYVEAHYGQWIRGKHSPPLLSSGVLQNVIAPLCKNNKRVVFMVFDCLRYDQFLIIEQILKNHFRIDRSLYCAILPSALDFARTALLAGKLPSEIASASTIFPATVGQESSLVNDVEHRLLSDRLVELGAATADRIAYRRIESNADADAVLIDIGQFDSKQVTAVVVECMRLIAQAGNENPADTEPIADEHALRSKTKSWFEQSAVFGLLRELSRQDCTVVCAAAYGSIYATHPTEVYGIKNSDPKLRYRIGSGISADERFSLVIADPGAFCLPRVSDDTVYVMAKEDYHYAPSPASDKFSKGQRAASKSLFCHGGISLEELFVPIAICTPR